MLLFFDTETTGLVDHRLPPGHPAQPGLVQLACLMTDDDGVERASCCMLVQPIGKTVSAEAAAVTGITQELAAMCGVYPTPAMYFWDRLAHMSDRIVAHNCRFDRSVMEAMWATFNPAFRATPSGFHERHPTSKWFCTMQASTGIVNLPPTEKMVAAGFLRPKSPKLSECVRHFFNEELAGAHDAMVDVRACARVYFRLKTLGAV